MAKLPIKDEKRGIWSYPKDHSSSSEEEEEEDLTIPEEYTEKNNNDTFSIAILNPSIPFDYKKAIIGNIAIEIIEDPNICFPKLNSLLNVTKQLQSKNSLDSDITTPIQSLLFATLLTIFQDIIPGYHVRQLTESERSVKVSQQVHQERLYDESIVDHYKRYLTLLTDSLKKSSLQSSSLLCLLELMVTTRHFNYHYDIIKHCLTFSYKRSRFDNLVSLYLQKCFESDESGELSSSILHVLSDIIHKHGYKGIRSQWLASLLNINTFLLSYDESVTKKKQIDVHNKKTYISKRERKAISKKSKLEKESQEAEAIMDQKQRNRYHYDTLRYLFRIYVGILRNPTIDVMHLVFDGLIRITPYIKSEYFDDMLLTLQSLLRNSIDTKKNHSFLLSCLCAIYSIHDQYSDRSSQECSLDLHLNDKSLYSSLLITKDITLLIKALEKGLCNRRQLPLNRMAAFIHRIFWICSNRSIESQFVISLLHVITRILKNPGYSSLRSYLLAYEDEDDCSYRDYNMNTNDLGLDDPDSCNMLTNCSIAPLLPLLREKRIEGVDEKLRELMEFE